ncbi:MAG: hypothetical protein B7Y35_02925 [Sphingomonadales bacterium 28-64-96]|nr:MAG: hypothetical protein B7Y35_02925 [Sphingomonadales bacterium 28-64-96]
MISAPPSAIGDVRLTLPRYYPGGPPPIDRISKRFNPIEMLRWMVSILPECDPAFQRAVELLAVLRIPGATIAQRQEIDRLAAAAVAWWRDYEAMHRAEYWAGFRWCMNNEFLAGRLQPEGEA